MIFAQGKKDVRLGTQTYHCDDGSFLLSSIELPLGGLVVEATKQNPLLILRLTIDIALVRDVLASSSLLPAAPLRDLGLVKGTATPELLDASVRLLELLESPDDISYLGRHVQREILYRLLRLPQGANLSYIATSGETGNRIANAVTWVKKNFSKAIHMSELADIAGVSRSTFNSRFRALTGLSPLQYQKQLRFSPHRTACYFKARMHLSLLSASVTKA